MTPIARIFSSLAIGVLFMGAFNAVQAAIVIQGTRVVFPAEDREVTMQINNSSEAPVLVQSWIDDGRADLSPQQMKVPFVVAPAVGRVEPGSGAVLRITYTQEPLPVDRESLYWLNVLEIPPRQGSDENALQFAFRTRIKLFFRPSRLQKDVDSAPDKLTWKVGAANAFKVGASDAGKLVVHVTNPTAYYISFGQVNASIDGKKIPMGTRTVAPFGQESFILPGGTFKGNHAASVQYEVINDYGGRRTLEKSLVE